MSLPKISIIGTGNVATHLSITLENAGFTLVEVYGRTLANAKRLANKLYDTNATSSLNFLESGATIFFLCISDSSIAEVSREMALPPGSLLIHCSGATPLHAIEKFDIEYGVFYPIQTFSLNRKITFNDVPICIEASTERAEEVLESIANRIGAQPFFMTSQQRLTLHLSAVFACNFTNHFFTIANNLLASEGLPFEILNAVIAETVEKALANGPHLSQTGPAIREDYNTMAKHRDLLFNKPEWKELYVKISQDIVSQKSNA